MFDGRVFRLAIARRRCKVPPRGQSFLRKRSFNGLVFEESMRSAYGAEGSEIVCTRQERALLM